MAGPADNSRLADKWRFAVAISADDDLGPAARRVAILFLERYDETRGGAWCGNEYIARKLRMTERTVRAGVSQLRKTAWFFIDKTGGVGRHRLAEPNWSKAAENFRLFQERGQEAADEAADFGQNRGQETATYSISSKPFCETGPPDGAGGASAAPPPAHVEAFKSAMVAVGADAWADLFDLDRSDGALVATARTDAAFDAVAGKAGRIAADFAAWLERDVPLRLVGPRGRVADVHTAADGGASSSPDVGSTAESDGATGDDEDLLAIPDFLRRPPKPEAADAA